MNYPNTVELVNKLLTDNSEWIIRYKNYTRKITANQKEHEDGRKKFRVNSPFYLYTSINNLLQYNLLRYDLRFLGQSVASVKVKSDSISINTNKKKERSNLKYFGIDVSLKNEDWNSYKYRKFRSNFSKSKSTRGHSKEHKIESSLLSEFKGKDRNKKALCNIQPVLLANTFFQMATPIKASLSKISYSNDKGGGIDILTRVKHKDNSVKLCVMELKDEFKGSEPPGKVMNQAVAYATFIANLLRSESGSEWYKIFGFSGDVPKLLTIDVSTLMPFPEKGELENFNYERLEVLDNTFIKLYSLYFKEKSKYIDGYNYEFQGSLKDEMMK